jgi:hypothetical protein
MGSSKDEDGKESSGLSLVNGSQTGTPETETADKATLIRLAQLRQEHRDLDEAIQALIESGAYDQLQLTRLKKRKLMLRDQITRVEDDMLPDIIA